MVSQSDYSQAQLAACKSVLIELVQILGEFRDNMAIVGGWVPPYLVDESAEAHIGTLDIDVALDFENISDDTYTSLLKALAERGYEQDGKQPFIFRRSIELDSQTFTVQVDFLSGEYGGTGKSRRTQVVQDIRARKARGCDLVFEHIKEIEVEGPLPGGGINTVSVNICGVVPFLVMKGMAIHDRMKEKDAYDIEYVIANYPGGPKTLAAAFLPHLSDTLVNEGLSKIFDKFASPDHIGPRWITDFLGIQEPDARGLRQRDAYDVVRSFMDELGIG